MVDDSFRTFPAPGTGPKMAMCPTCKEPLVATLEFRGAEFICMVCKELFGFMAPVPAEPTPELEARHDELRALYDIERTARRGGDKHG